ncbi:D-2-hydroxyacid dehydrogenase [Rhodohalobacter sp. 8-1]|uniref:D-2-hydroxyacid dehydrogenase n=1 Tax=Rhodohalobacter sp. 8-1 TaxID=3131972 RepID=UPI0030EDC977
MNIVFLDASTVGDVPNLNSLKELGDVTFYDVTSAEETAERISKAEVVITNKVVMTRELMQNAENLKLICIAATGMNNVDREAAADLGIEVKNVAGYASVSVAQTTFAMILHLLQDIQSYDAYVKSKEYSKSPIFTNMDQNYHEISGMRLGIIGLGNIGKKVADIAEAFGAEVVYYSTSGKNTDQPYTLLELDDLLTTSDIVSIHAPLNENTENLIGAEQLRLMKSSALLINTGRGGIVNEADLARELDKESIAGAALDVFENEPIKADNPLLGIDKKDRLVLTPHIAWASVEARTELIEGVKKNIEEFVNN